MNFVSSLRALFAQKPPPIALQESEQSRAVSMERSVAEEPYELDSTSSDDVWLITLEGVAITRYNGTYDAAAQFVYHLNAAYNLGYDTGLTMGKHKCKTS